MQELYDRKLNILMAAIEEYIRSGEPVSSKSLFKDYDFGIRPASIRSELNELERNGWLSQPHTSGGRIPTNKAFEFFAENVKSNVNEDQKLEKSFFDLAELFIEKDFKDFVSRFSDEVHLLSVSFNENERETYKSGLDELFSEIDAAPSRVFYEIAKDLEAMDQRMEEFVKDAQNEDAGPRVFIGKKSPFIKSDLVSTVFDVFHTDDSKIFFAAFGPKRMDYKKSVNAFIKIRKAIEELGV